MYTTIGLTTIAFIVSFFYCLKNEEDKDFETIIFLLGFSTMISGIFCIIGVAISICLPTKYETTTWTESLSSLKENTSIEGSFALASGNINGTMKYEFYVKNTDGTYTLHQVNCSDSKIRYVKTDPKLIVTSHFLSKSIWNKFVFTPDWLDKSTQSFVFEIPENSINKNYNLNK